MGRPKLHMPVSRANQSRPLITNSIYDKKEVIIVMNYQKLLHPIGVVAYVLPQFKGLL
jgi:hypothetical protein